MNFEFEILKKNRKLVLKVIDGLSIEQLNKIPDSFNNNIVWNIGHMLVTQQLLCYNFSNLPMLVSENLVESYRKGTSPNAEVSFSDFKDMKSLFSEFTMQLERDYQSGIFKTYRKYTTSVDITLSDINAAIAFNNLHEGIHLGVILSLRKLV